MSTVISGPGSRRRRTPTLLVALTLLLAPSAAGCSWFSHDQASSSAPTTSVSVFKLVPGTCFNPPSDVKAELSTLTAMPCTTAHTQEFYSAVDYRPPAGIDGSVYPGDAALATFANGSCAQAFAGYVGISYLDSSLFFTYLVPSARSWQAQDRAVSCFVTTTGKPLTSSVKNSKL